MELLSLFFGISLAWAQAPKDFTALSDIDPSIQVEMRYLTKHNFVGAPIDGYKANKCILTKKTALALKRVQSELKEKSMSLKVYDCFRPQKSVDHFLRWTKDVKDNKMKTEFYPNIDKSNLFKLGYIASKSGHTRGSTLDVTIVSLEEFEIPKGKSNDCRSPYRQRDNSIDMGTNYDCFSPLSHTMSPLVTPLERENRLLLKTSMEKHGFKNFKKEWWHFTLNNEPHKKTYFDFNIQ